MNGSVPRGAAEVISQAIEDDQVFTDTDGYRSIRMRGAEKYAEIALAALEAAGFVVLPSVQRCAEARAVSGDEK
jgi:hypothetical protein